MPKIVILLFLAVAACSSTNTVDSEPTSSTVNVQSTTAAIASHPPTSTTTVVPLATVDSTPIVDTTVAQPAGPGYELNDVNPADFIRFSNDTDAEYRRSVLIGTIWPDGIPAAVPTVTAVDLKPQELESVDDGLLAAIEMAVVDVFGFESIVYVLKPPNPNGSLAIIHGGHNGDQQYLSHGLAEVAEALLVEGHTVAAMQMPFSSWNSDMTGVLPDGSAIVLTGRQTAGHYELFDFAEPALGPQVIRIFVEPVIQIINAYGNEGTFMTGISGGGWTTHVAAAVDVRIRYSVPVAGSLPLYVRPFSPGSASDTEQHYPPIFGESDSDDDGAPDSPTGAASWLEIYALGASGAGRQQVQVLNLRDSCCFGGDSYLSYSEFLHERQPQWSLYSDDSHAEHRISDVVVGEVIIPLARIDS